MSGEWVVLLEAMSPPSGDDLDQATLSRLLAAVEQAEPIALHSLRRYAVQLKVRAENPADALSSALARWTEALRSVGAPGWEVVRAEVMTKAELEQELAGGKGTVDELTFESRVSEGGERAALAEQLLHDAFHDPVTGLAGEGLVRDQLDWAVAEARRRGSRLAVLVVNFREVRELSETLGAGFAEAALVVLAERLLGTICLRDVAGRVGDDCFVVLRQDCSEEQAVTLSEQIRESMRAPITVVDREIEGEVAVGVALSDSGEDLLRRAVAALEKTKKSPGKEGFSGFRR